MAQPVAPNAPNGDAPFVDPDTGRLTPSGLLVLTQIHRQIVAGYVLVPCLITGTNVLLLTPILSSEGAASYGDHMPFAGMIQNDSTGLVTARVGALATVKVFADNGAVQATAGDLFADTLRFFTYASALDAGNGGLVLN